MSDHHRNSECLQSDLIRRMSPLRRLETAASLYETAWQLKKSGLKAQHPDWSEEEIESKTRRVFLTGYAGN